MSTRLCLALPSSDLGHLEGLLRKSPSLSFFVSHFVKLTVIALCAVSWWEWSPSPLHVKDSSPAKLNLIDEAPGSLGSGAEDDVQQMDVNRHVRSWSWIN